MFCKQNMIPTSKREKEMLFNSLQYAVFLPIIFALYWALPHKYRQPLLLAASYYFYMSWNVKYVALILFTTAVSYTAAVLLERTDRSGKRRLLLMAALVACLGVLFVFKYFDFFFASLAAVLQRFVIPLHPTTLNLLLPVGISFYTFQTLSYVIDVYRGDVEAERNFMTYALFVSFFPQLVAGPIERTKNLLPQLKAEHTFDYNQATYGLKLMAWGYFKKLVVADNLAVYVDRVFDNVYSFQGFALLLAAFFFTIQIYCDFSGYSDIARGTAKLLGIDLMENFKSPYFSASIQEFWSRWHISLSTWFRDYVYIPLGGNRVSKARHYWNLLVTFLISGLWHGANWTFVIWGGLHGLAQIGENALRLRREERRGSVRWWLRVLLVFVFVMLAWVFFRAQTLNEAVYVFRHMLDGIGAPAGYFRNGLKAIEMGMYGFLRSIFVYLLPLFAFDLFALRIDLITAISQKRVLIRYSFYCLLMLSLIFFHAIGEFSFVYFQF